MTKQISLKIVSFFIVVALIVLSITGDNISVSAKTENPFESAISITPGTYTGELAKSDPVDSYKIQGKAGNELVIKLALTAKGVCSVADIVIYNEDREELHHEVGIIASPTRTVTLNWLTSVNQSIYTVITYSAAFESAGAGPGSYSLTYSLEDRSDANSGRDAGDTPETAIKIYPGEYKGYLAWAPGGPNKHIASFPYKGNDFHDTYTLHLEAGQAINVKVTPEDGAVVLYLMDSDRVVVYKGASKNKGAIVRASWVVNQSQSFYIVVSTIDAGGMVPWVVFGVPMLDQRTGEVVKYQRIGETKFVGGAYELEVETSTPSPTSSFSPTPTPTPVVTPPVTPTSSPSPMSPSFEAILAIGGLFAVAYLLRRRK
ncbi:MAG: PGF-CTERM sorting domain-containing protein [Halobacteriota archaeon]